MLPTSADHEFHRLVRWDPRVPAEQIADGVLMIRSNSNRCLVTTPDGDVVINTGDPAQAARHRAQYEAALGRPLATRSIVITQSHGDHYSGWSELAGPDVEIIAHDRLLDGIQDRLALAEYFARRRRRTTFWGRELRPSSPETLAAERTAFSPTSPITPTVTFHDTHSFELGGRLFELISTSGGETRDSIAVWLPSDELVFIGNLLGPFYGHLPNLATIRGDRIRSARAYVASVNRIIDLGATTVVTGHGDPITGGELIRSDLTRLRDAVQHIHDETIRGMNEGVDLHTLMTRVQLPPELEVGRGRCRLEWCVRSIWEEYSGWFRFESPTELYDVPARAVWADIVELTGGVEGLVDKAAEHLRGGGPLQALHLLDIVHAQAPLNGTACALRCRALEEMIRRSGGISFDEIAYLESELAIAQKDLDRASAGPSAGV